jgi:predicted Fe-Mo cluster-binding NifX family protein
VYRGAKGDVAEAVQAWLEGALKDKKTVCDGRCDGEKRDCQS